MLAQSGKEVEYRDGTINFYEDRVVLFPPKIITILGNIYAEGSKPFLIFLGKKNGRALAERWEEYHRPKTVRQMVQVYVDLFNTLGWGEFSIEKIEPENDPDLVILKLRNNVARRDESPRHHICDFIAGFLYGLGEFIMHDAYVEEPQCSVQPPGLYDECVFHIKKRQLTL